MIDSTGLAARRPPDQRPLGATTAAEWSVAATRGAPSRRQQHERRRAADLGIRTLHGRQAPPPGRQPTTRRQSRSHSGPLRLPNPPVHHRVPPRDPKSARQRRFPAPLTPPGPPRRHPYLEHQSDTGAPSPSWHPQAYHGVAYTDRSNARMALMAPLHMRDLPTLSSAASSCWVPPAVFRSARRSPIEQNSPWSTISRPLCAPPSAATTSQ